jgi:RNA polymerase sigma-70 factor (ECF subfamily)
MTDPRDRWDDDALLDAIRAGEESAFSELVARYELGMLKMAEAFLGDRISAEEVVQETWLAFVKAIRRFKHRSSVKTWLFGILLNQARKQAARRPKEWTLRGQAPREDATGSSDWFDEVGEWRSQPVAWGSNPELDLLSQEAIEYIYEAIASLPEKQRAVFILSAIEGWTPEEVCELMKISSTNRRVLLHLAKSRLQQRLDEYFGKRRKSPPASGSEDPKP